MLEWWLRNGKGEGMSIAVIVVLVVLVVLVVAVIGLYNNLV